MPVIDFAGPLLLTTPAQGFRPLGFGGEPIHNSYRKLEAVIESRLGPGAARYLARPELDEASHSVGWHATCDGPVRRWRDLPPEEMVRLTPIFTGLQDKLRDLAHDLEASSHTGGATENFGQALRLALRSPGLDYLFFVGDQPVLALWGVEGGTSVLETPGFEPKTVRRAPPVVEIAPTVVSRPWWRGLLWLLGLILLVLLVLFLLRSCMGIPIPIVSEVLPDLSQPAPQVQPGTPPDNTTSGQNGTTTVEPNGTTTVIPNGTTTVGPNGTTTVGPNGTTTAEPGGTTVGPGNGTAVVPGTDGGTTQGGNETATTPPGSTTTPEVPSGTEGVQNPATTPPTGENQPESQIAPPPGGQQAQPPGAETPGTQPPGTQPLANQPPGTQPPGAQPPGTQPNGTQPPGTQPPGAQPPGTQPPGTQPPGTQAGNPPTLPQSGQPGAGNNPPPGGLKIPPPGTAGQGLAFLQGQWRSKTSLYDRATGKPLTQTYSFDANGNGTVTIYRSDSSQCKGQARAQMTAKGVRIQDSGPITCPDGTTYAPSVTQCERTQTGAANCTGVNKAGSTYHVEIAR